MQRFQPPAALLGVAVSLLASEAAAPRLRSRTPVRLCWPTRRDRTGKRLSPPWPRLCRLGRITSSGTAGGRLCCLDGRCRLEGVLASAEAGCTRLARPRHQRHWRRLRAPAGVTSTECSRTTRWRWPWRAPASAVLPVESLWWASPARMPSQRLGENSSAPRRTAELALRRKRPDLNARDSL